MMMMKLSLLLLFMFVGTAFVDCSVKRLEIKKDYSTDNDADAIEGGQTRSSNYDDSDDYDDEGDDYDDIDYDEDFEETAGDDDDIDYDYDDDEKLRQQKYS